MDLPCWTLEADEHKGIWQSWLDWLSARGFALWDVESAH